MTKTVFFGPFIGEFGWELTHWSGWVRLVSDTDFRDCHRIVASARGRAVLYPHADEFWPLPEWWEQWPKNARNYVVDHWVDGFPRDNGAPPPADAIAMRDVADRLLEEFRARLPRDAQVLCPFRRNWYAPQALAFGFDAESPVRSNDDLWIHRIPYRAQRLAPLQASPAGRRELTARLGVVAGPVIALFPRRRDVRPELNWSAENYRKLVGALQAHGFTIAVLGEPGGCHFVDGVPDGCIDLIDLPRERRLDLHLACLEKAELALGAFSGAIHFALAAGCPTLAWGPRRRRLDSHRLNYLGSRHYYYGVPDCSVAKLVSHVVAFHRRTARYTAAQRWAQLLNASPRLRKAEARVTRLRGVRA